MTGLLTYLIVKSYEGPKKQIAAMNRVKNIINNANLSGIAFPFSKEYAAWETDEVYLYSLLKNDYIVF